MSEETPGWAAAFRSTYREGWNRKAILLQQLGWGSVLGLGCGWALGELLERLQLFGGYTYTQTKSLKNIDSKVEGGTHPVSAGAPLAVCCFQLAGQ